VIARRFFESVRQLDAWAVAFLASGLLWTVAMVLALSLFVWIALWYRKQGGVRPRTSVRDAHATHTHLHNEMYTHGHTRDRG
jgi:hypothetical protein